MLHGKPFPGTAEARLHLVGDEHDAVGPCPLGQPGQEAFRGNDEAALALDRLDQQRRQLVRADLLLDRQDGPFRSFHTRDRGVFLPVRVAHRHPVDLRRKRPETGLVGHGLGGQAHGEVGTAVVGMVEGNHGVAAGGGAGNLHGVLHRFGTGIEQDGPLLEVAGGHLGKPLGHGHVPLIGGDHKAGVCKVLRLLLHGSYDGGVRGAYARHRNARSKVRKGVPVHVQDDSAVGVGRVNGHAGGNPLGHHGGTAGLERRGLGTREGAGDPAFLFQAVIGCDDGGAHDAAFQNVLGKSGVVIQASSAVITCLMRV